MSTPELDVTVAAAVPIVPARYRRPAMVDPFDISHEMSMAKSALLYADRVSLASWRVSIVRAWASIREGRRTGDAARVIRLLTAVEWAAARPGVKEASPVLGALARLSVEGLTVDAVEFAVGKRLGELDVLLDAAMDMPSWLELREAEELGVLEILPMGAVTGFGFSREAAVVEYLQLVREMTDPTSRNTPMLDYSAAGVLEVGTRVGVLSRPLPRATSEMALAGHYMGYLPAFPRADLVSVLKAREELRSPLVRFRSLMAELSREIEVAPTQPEFGAAAEELFRREVAPQLDAIAQLSRERGLLSVIREEVIESQGGTAAKAVIGLAAASVAGLPAFAEAAVGALVAAADVAGAVHRRRRELNVERMGNRVFWLYQLEEKLAKSDGDEGGDS